MRYAGDFLPSWAGAISIDLMPAVLVLIFCVVHANIRREDEPVADAEHHDGGRHAHGAAARARSRGRRAMRRRAAAVPAAEAPLAPSDENVTPLATARARKKD